MILPDSLLLMAMAAIIKSMAALVWSCRRKK